MFKPLVSTLTFWAVRSTLGCALSCALSGAWAAAISQGETPSTPLCVDTGHARITRLCANVILRYKIDALMDVPLSNYGLTWTPISWTINQPNGSSKALPADRLPLAVTKALALVTMQLKGTALVDFSANAPLQFLQYQTNAVAMQNKVAWTGAARSPMGKWLFAPGQCQDGQHQIMDPAKAMALYKLGVKSLSIDPRTSASVCKTGTTVSQLDAAVRALDRYCQNEASALPGLCPATPQADVATKGPETTATLTRWASLLDDGIPAQLSRPSMTLLDEDRAPRLADRGPAQTVSSATHFPD